MARSTFGSWTLESRPRDGTRSAFRADLIVCLMITLDVYYIASTKGISFSRNVPWGVVPRRDILAPSYSYFGLNVAKRPYNSNTGNLRKAREVEFASNNGGFLLP